VYDFPRTRFVAEFLGAANLIEARLDKGGVETDFGFLHLEKDPPWKNGLLAIRPEWIRIRENRPETNGVKARVTETIYRGTNYDLWLEPGPLRVRTSSYKNFHPGDEVWLELSPSELVILDG
jgi:spermidine/putrescine transport system ATP-binding protein